MATSKTISTVIWEPGALLQALPAIDALGEFIRALRPQFRVALMSHSWTDLRQVMVSHWELVDAFDEVLLSSDEEKISDPDIYVQAGLRLNVPPGDAVVVVCRPACARAAITAGMQAVLFDNAAQVGSELFGFLQQDLS